MWTIIALLATFPNLNLNRQEIHCLAQNIYYEARGEPWLGQVAVAHVTLNRASSSSPSICDVVFKPHQFSWTSLRLPPPNYASREWRQSVQIAIHASTGLLSDPTRNATYFSTKQPTKLNATPTLHVGGHIFLAERINRYEKVSGKKGT